ncbi:Signal transduction histidine kinase [Lutibacter maritimus]|uniref:histidine kinase n=1 Tax=Lutibacter maritimus TaxID=593133 RepID=A0A1I6NX22_9FLAO|nr:Signal transduction histidine kinase [Lutibacter maritimus]
MNIDVHTLFYIFSLGKYLIIFFLSVYVIFYNVKNPILYIFIISKILYAFLWILLALRDNIPWFYGVVLPNTFLIFAIFLDLYSIINANKKFAINHFKRSITIPVVLSIVFLFAGNLHEGTRIVVMSIIIAFLYIAGSLLLIFKKDKTKIQELVSFLCFLIGLTFVFRSFWAYFQESSVILNINNNVQIISYLLLIIGSFSFPMILLLILKEVEEKEIKIKNETLIQSNKNKTNFFAIIAHDLKGPLGTYTQMIELLINRHKEMPASKIEEFLVKLHNSSKQTFHLLENLLQWSRAESGTIKVHPEYVQLKNIFNPVILLMKNSISIKNLSLEVHIQEEATVYCDYNMIMTVVRNLISNAIKFTPNNGKIIITSNINTENYIEISFEDSGVGISKENLKTIFDLNFNSNTKGTNNESGTGLGLKLAKEYIEKNNGFIGIESEVNVGTKVWIQIPTTEL